jgi:hypothetical protein
MELRRIVGLASCLVFPKNIQRLAELEVLQIQIQLVRQIMINDCPLLPEKSLTVESSVPTTIDPVKILKRRYFSL